MATVGELKSHAVRLFGKGEHMHALRLYDAIVASAPLHYEARLRVADCLLALGHQAESIQVYRAVAWYSLKSGHPLLSVVIARVLEEMLGSEADDLMTGLVAHYGSESEILGKFAARINAPAPTTSVASPPDLHAPPPAEMAASASQRATHCCDDFDQYPEVLHPIPLLSALSEASFRKVVRTLVVRRLPACAPVILQGEPGQSFFFVACGGVRVFAGGTVEPERELARLHETSIFGEMALLSAQPRSASVETLGEADLLEVTRESLQALAGELEQVATALHRFTMDRLLQNLIATHRLFKPFSAAQRRDLLRRFTSHDLAPGTSVIREADEGAGLFVVLTGELEVNKGQGANATLLATLRSGDLFGEMALVRGGPTTATVTAATRATVLFLAREYVDRIIAGVPEIREYLEALSEDRALDTQLVLGEEESDLGDDVIIFI